eukprot:TRINITY_DN6426_c0_g1_i1.p2 TRINITY_DN6426_c0_g1~~TRINITY_DN6426_c0_g1_i1.p2  ORF type:complete len:88 (-),score=12.22 TRINITY_DN6426_c0_g1_i1:28-291(-)
MYALYWNRHKIEELSLESNDIRNEGFDCICDLLRKTTSLWTLKLSNQRQPISTRAMEALVDAISANKSLTKVSVDWRQNNFRTWPLV